MLLSIESSKDFVPRVSCLRNRMRVALDIRTINPRFPGIGRYVTNLVRHLPSCLAATDFLMLILESGAERPRAGICGETVIHFCETSAGVFSLAQRWDLPRRLKDRGVELLHFPLLTVPVPLPIPQILTLHDLIPIRLPQYVSWRARRFFPGVLRKQLKQVTRVIVPSEFTKQELLRWSRFPAERVRVIPHAAAEPFHQSGQDEVSRVRRKFSLSEYLLALASNRAHKNLERLEQAYRASNVKVPLVIAGAGRESREEFSDGPRIIRLGEIPEADLPGLYAGARLFVFPSLYEGFGLPVLEAMASGCAVACAGNTALPEVAGSSACYFDPYSRGEIRSCLEALLNDPQQLKGLQRQGLARSLDFGWQESARATAALYRDVLNDA